jgi:hypothetical protein
MEGQMAEYSLTRQQLSKGIPVLEKHAALFRGLKPHEMVRQAKRSGLGGVLPKTKEEMALMAFAFKQLRFDKAMWDKVKEVKQGRDGKISILMGNVNEDDMAKHKHYVVPKGSLYDLKKELKNIY